MEIEILGAHLTEIASAKPTALLIDGVLAVDAGSLCSNLSLAAQQKLKAILITHCHYDHVRDIPFIGMNVSSQGSIEIYSIPPTLKVLSSRLLDGKMYPNFLKWPEDRPALKFVALEPYDLTNVSGYSVLAIPVAHTTPTVGFQVASPEGKKLFYTGDTGVGLSACWEYVSPDLLITELSMPQCMEEWARKVGHLTPNLLKEELLQFRKIKGHIPPIILIHLDPSLEDEIEKEVNEVAEELGANITLGREGMKVQL